MKISRFAQLNCDCKYANQNIKTEVKWQYVSEHDVQVNDLKK